MTEREKPKGSPDCWGKGGTRTVESVYCVHMSCLVYVGRKGESL